MFCQHRHGRENAQVLNLGQAMIGGVPVVPTGPPTWHYSHFTDTGDILASEDTTTGPVLSPAGRTPALPARRRRC